MITTLSEELRNPVPTEAVANEALKSPIQTISQDLPGWQTAIDDRLVEWGKDLRALEDEDIVPPSLQIIDLACRLAMEMRDDDYASPLRVVPNGEGGIVFESWPIQVEEGIEEGHVIEINSDGSIELIVFANSQVVSREPWDFR